MHIGVSSGPMLHSWDKINGQGIYIITRIIPGGPLLYSLKHHRTS